MSEIRSIQALSDNDRYRILIDAIADYAIYLLDAEGHVASWNPGAQRFKGYTADEIVGQHFSRFYTPEDRAANLPARVLRTAAAEGRFEAEGWRVRKDGTRFWAHVIVDAIHDDKGNVIGFAKVTRDLTERREAAQALAQAKEELLQSQKMEAIGRLTGGVAHDFNNLLMAITGSLELLRKRIPEDPRLIRLIDNALQGAQRGASLTQRMLAFARRQELRPDLVDIGQLISSMTDLLSRSLGPTIEIETYTVGPLSRVLIDANQLELAILNLAVNAKDAMSEGGRLLISTREEQLSQQKGPLAPGHYVTLSLNDNGTGMDADTLAHATEPFFTTKGVGKGTGLGLAMVRGLTEQSGGTVIIDSELGKGTTVTLWLPEFHGEAIDTVSVQQPERVEPAAPRPLKVLVVDDDFLVAMNTSAMLEDLGHQVVEVHSGPMALEELQADGFDLMITDQAMPQMTGIQLIDAARQSHPSLPVILATGYAELPAGADPSIPRLSKPFFQADLEKALTQIGPRAG
jgi:PAS domain S-box-containing protein